MFHRSFTHIVLWEAACAQVRVRIAYQGVRNKISYFLTPDTHRHLRISGNKKC